MFENYYWNNKVYKNQYKSNIRITNYRFKIHFVYQIAS